MKKSNVYAGPGIDLNTLDAVSRILENLYASGYDKRALNDAISWKLKEMGQTKAKQKKGVV